MVNFHLTITISIIFFPIKLQIVWEPYTDDILQKLPNYCQQGRHMWRAMVPLICFHIIEWHQPDRVMRQFGLQQPIPQNPRQTDDLHSFDLRQSDTNWAIVHAHWIAIWDARMQWIVLGTPSSEGLHYHSQYMEWYRRVARRWISHTGAAIGAVVSTFTICYILLHKLLY
jgi:hypothetical protein